MEKRLEAQKKTLENEVNKRNAADEKVSSSPIATFDPLVFPLFFKF